MRIFNLGQIASADLLGGKSNRRLWKPRHILASGGWINALAKGRYACIHRWIIIMQISLSATHSFHDDVIKWKHFPRYWPFVRGIHRSPVNSPHKGQWRGAFMFSFICAWINRWVNNREGGDLRRYRTHYDVIVMFPENLNGMFQATKCGFVEVGLTHWSWRIGYDLKCTMSKHVSLIETQSCMPKNFTCGNSTLTKSMAEWWQQLLTRFNGSTWHGEGSMS